MKPCEDERTPPWSPRSTPRLTNYGTTCRRSRSRSKPCLPRSQREWVTQDGRYKVEILPKGDPTDNETLRQFARAVQAVEPNATGGPIAILEVRAEP